MIQSLSFDDVLIVPQFSTIKSRKDVDVSQYFYGMKLRLPIISSNMDTVTNSGMTKAMGDAGGIGALHRFNTIEENVKEFKLSHWNTIVSIGLGGVELERAKALYDAGATTFLIDVAHGASMEVVNQTKALRELTNDDCPIIVGNFATGQSITDFQYHLGNTKLVQSYKVGIGGGSACLTRVVTGCGVPTLASIIDCVRTGVSIIADGGMRNSGDVAKALAAGADMVMLGGMLAGTDETPGEIVDRFGKTFRQGSTLSKYKKYRGSASTESYEVQGKAASHRSYEGDSFFVPYKGSVQGVLQQIEGGLRSALSYVGASNLEEFREFADLIVISGASIKENGSHGKN